MNPHPYIIFALLLLMPMQAFSQYEQSQPVTLALTSTSTAPNLIARKENGNFDTDAAGKPFFTFSNTIKLESVFQSATINETFTKLAITRISNKEVLDSLVRAGLISTIQGYSIVFFTSGEGGNATFGNKNGFYVVKRGEAAIDISDHISLTNTEANDKFQSGIADATQSKHVVVRNVAAGIEQHSLVGKSSLKKDALLIIDFPEYMIKADGVASWTSTMRLIPSDGTQKPVAVLGAYRFSNISGTLLYRSQIVSNQPVRGTIIEGSMSFGAATVRWDSSR